MWCKTHLQRYDNGALLAACLYAIFVAINVGLAGTVLAKSHDQNSMETPAIEMTGHGLGALTLEAPAIEMTGHGLGALTLEAPAIEMTGHDLGPLTLETPAIEMTGYRPEPIETPVIEMTGHDVGPLTLEAPAIEMTGNSTMPVPLPPRRPLRCLEPMVANRAVTACACPQGTVQRGNTCISGGP